MNEFSLAIQEFYEKRGLEKKKNLDINEELEKASKDASKIELASHVMKFSHSGSKGSNILYEPGDLKLNLDMKHFMSTETLTNKRLDFSGNAALIPVYKLLMIEIRGETLRDRLRRGDSSPLEPFTESLEQLKLWMERFKKMESKNLPSAHKAKQVYFPLNEGGYHLVCPLFSSSLSQYFFEVIKIFSEETKKAISDKKGKKFSEHGLTYFDRFAKISIGGTKPQNVSFLNSKRGGKVDLFNALPPQWKNAEKPPLTEKIFWLNFLRVSRVDFKKYIKFLEEEKENNLVIRIKSNSFRSKIYHVLFEYVESIFGFDPGWSKNSSLGKAFKIWLDPLNEEFEIADGPYNWKEIIAEDFSLNFYKTSEDYGLKLDSSNRQIIKREFLDELKRRFRS